MRKPVETKKPVENVKEASDEFRGEMRVLVLGLAIILIGLVATLYMNGPKENSKQKQEKINNPPIKEHVAFRYVSEEKEKDLLEEMVKELEQDIYLSCNNSIRPKMKGWINKGVASSYCKSVEFLVLKNPALYNYIVPNDGKGNIFPPLKDVPPLPEIQVPEVKEERGVKYTF